MGNQILPLSKLGFGLRIWNPHYLTGLRKECTKHFRHQRLLKKVHARGTEHVLPRDRVTPKSEKLTGTVGVVCITFEISPDDGASYCKGSYSRDGLSRNNARASAIVQNDQADRSGEATDANECVFCGARQMSSRCKPIHSAQKQRQIQLDKRGCVYVGWKRVTVLMNVKKGYVIRYHVCVQ